MPSRMQAIVTATFATVVLLANAGAASAQQSMPSPVPSGNCPGGPMDHSRMDHSMMDHSSAPMAAGRCPGTLPVQPAQAAYGAIGEVVRLLEADSATDWSRVDIEALRQHLIDMDDVVMRSAVGRQTIPGGLSMTVTGQGRTAMAIKRMVTSHASMLNQDPRYRASASPLESGVRLTVTARDPSDARTVAMIRGLGFAGLLTEGDHHAQHHMAVARGDASMR